MEFDQEIIPSNQVSLDYADQLQPDFRFCPKDSELITFYLNAKIHPRNLPKFRLHEVNIYDHNPEELAERYPSSENKWYFLTPRDRKYPKGNRPKRDVGKFGYWKTTQKQKPVYDAKTRQMVGHKGTLAFYNKKRKTKWLMHEYTTNGPNLHFGENTNKLKEWVLCKIYKKESKQNTTINSNPHGATPLPRRRRVSENREINVSNNPQQVDVGHVQMVINQSVGYKDDQIIRMNTCSPYPIPMQPDPMTTFHGSSLLQAAAPPCYDQNQFTSSASNSFQISNGALNSVSMQQLLDGGAFTNTTPTPWNGLQISNGVLNSSSCVEQLDYGGYTTDLAEDWYKDDPTLHEVQNVLDHLMEDDGFDFPQQDGYMNAPISGPNETEWSVELVEMRILALHR